MGFGHRVYRAEDPRARVLRRTAEELGAPRFEVAEALEQAALEELRARRPTGRARDQRRVLGGDRPRLRRGPRHMFTSMFTCARTGRLVRAHPGAEAHRPPGRPSARYIGPGPRKPDEVEGWDTITTPSISQPPAAPNL